ERFRSSRTGPFPNARKRVAGKHHLLLALYFPMGARSKQRTFVQLAPAGCLFARKRMASSGGPWRAELPSERSVRVAVSAFRVSARIWRCRAANGARFLLSIGGSSLGICRAAARCESAEHVRQ